MCGGGVNCFSHMYTDMLYQAILLSNANIMNSSDYYHSKHMIICGGILFHVPEAQLVNTTSDAWQLMRAATLSLVPQP